MAKTKTFITAIPFQAEGQLKLTSYLAQGNKKLEYCDVTRFPIIPVINGYAEKGDTIRIIAIVTDAENFHHNYKTYFESEISPLVKDKGYILEGIETIISPDDEDIETQLKLFADIIEKIKDGEELHACITYGTKPTPIVQFMALNYAFRIKNISIGCMAYGRFLHKGEEDGPAVGRIYDQTALFYMGSIVNRLAENNASAPEKAIRIMLGLDSDIEEDEQNV